MLVQNPDMFNNLTARFMTPFSAGSWTFGPLMPLAEKNGHIIPAIDMVEKEKEFQITAEVPGMNEKDIDISVSNGILTMKGEKREEKEEKKKDYHVSERRFGSFERVLRLPANVDSDNIRAKFSKGVINVTLPKKAGVEAKEKKIAIAAE
jgi:HSP20 family protein